MRIKTLLPFGAVIASTAIFGCSSNNSSSGPSVGGNTNSIGGAANTSSHTGGTTANSSTAIGGASQGGTSSSAQGGSGNPTGGASSAQSGSGGSNVGGGNTGGAPATGGKSSTTTSGSGGGNVGGTAATGGKSSTSGSGGANIGGTSTNGGTAATGGKTSTGGAGGGNTGGTTSPAGGGNTGGTTGAPISGCANTDTSVINQDASGYVCNNTWGIKGAWYCYSDGADSGISCKGSDGKGKGAIPWNTSSSAMCLSGTMGTGEGSYAGIGFKVNSGPPGDTAEPGTWNASSIVGFAITLAPGASGKGSGGMILNLEYPTSDDLDPNTKDAPGITVPGVPTSGTITYNALFSDAVLANNANNRTSVAPSKLTDVKIAFFPDSISHTYDFCIKSIVPLTTAPNPVVATGSYGPTWNNQQPQAVNGVNGYAVQSAPFPTNGNPMTMQVTATSGGVGFTYTTGSGFNAPNNGPGSFPAVVSGWGPGHDGIQFYGPYKTAKQISALTSVKSSWSFSMGSSGNAVYDLWFGNSATPTVPQVELMIWIGNKDKEPIGYNGGTAAGSAVNGRTPFTGTNGTGEKVVSYWVAKGTNGSPVSDFDVLAYIKDAASKGYAGLSNSSYLLGVQTGFEVYGGAWTTTDYNITIQ